jgi:hypothetical protein
VSVWGNFETDLVPQYISFAILWNVSRCSRVMFGLVCGVRHAKLSVSRLKRTSFETDFDPHEFLAYLYYFEAILAEVDEAFYFPCSSD